MSQSRVSRLHLVDGGASIHITEDAMLTRIGEFVHENLLDLSGDIEADVQLEHPQSDERKLGPLSAFERRAFTLTALLEQRIHDIVVEVEASGTEQIAAIMRERKINFMQATHVFISQNKLPADQRIEINRATMTHTNLVTLYDWSVRQRFNEWTSFLIVRTGFVVFAYG